ncbi:WhiB family transcriptional regulator [Streptomyces sp. NPDC003333]
MTPAVPDGGSRIWELRAACREWDADLWFTRRTWPLAVAICALCPVLEPCRDAVLRRERGLPRCRRQGVVAGLTGPQRHALEQGGLAAPPTPAPRLTPTAPPEHAPSRPGETASTEPAAPRVADTQPHPVPFTAAGEETRPAPGRRPSPSVAPSEPTPPLASREETPPASGRCVTEASHPRSDDTAPHERRTPERGDAPPRTRPAPCGTRAAYQRHLRRGEPVDAACRAANTYEAGRYRRTGSTRARPPRPPD